MPTERTPLVGADFVRSLACLGVLIHHLAQKLDPGALAPALRPVHAMLMLGSFGVAAFFVLSGYLLARPFWQALDAGRPMPSTGAYALRRFARIAPGFWVALTASFVLSFAVFGFPLDANLILRYLAGLTFVSDWHWLTMFPVEANGPLWSIGFEVSSYLFLPLCLALLFFGRRFGLAGWPARLSWLGVILIALGAHAATLAVFPIGGPGTGWRYGLVGGAREWMPEYNPFGFFAIFAIGALAAGLQTQIAARRGRLFDFLALGGLALMAASVAGYVPRVTTEGWGFMRIPYGFPLFPLGVGLVLATAPSTLRLGRLFEAGFFRFVALVSFGLYIWHYLVIELMRELIWPELAYAGIRALGSWFALSAVAVAVSLALAMLSYRLIEAPALAWGRRVEARLRGKTASPDPAQLSQSKAALSSPAKLTQAR